MTLNGSEKGFTQVYISLREDVDGGLRAAAAVCLSVSLSPNRTTYCSSRVIMTCILSPFDVVIWPGLNTPENVPELHGDMFADIWAETLVCS